VNVLRLLPALLSCLALGAHLLRAGRPGPGLAVALLPLLLLARRRWAVRTLQLALLAGAVEWLRTLVLLAGLRRAEQLPWTRMAVILGAVAALAAVSALLLEARMRVAAPRPEATPRGLEAGA
jgi:hypothetical protein